MSARSFADKLKRDQDEITDTDRLNWIEAYSHTSGGPINDGIVHYYVNLGVRGKSFREAIDAAMRDIQDE